MEAFILGSLMVVAFVVGSYFYWDNIRDMFRDGREYSDPEPDEPPVEPVGETPESDKSRFSQRPAQARRRQSTPSDGGDGRRAHQ